MTIDASRNYYVILKWKEYVIDGVDYEGVCDASLVNPSDDDMVVRILASGEVELCHAITNDSTGWSCHSRTGNILGYVYHPFRDSAFPRTKKLQRRLDTFGDDVMYMPGGPYAYRDAELHVLVSEYEELKSQHQKWRKTLKGAK